MILDFLQRISPVVHAEAPRRPRLAREVIARQIGNDVIIVDDAGFDEALLIAENASDYRSAAFFRRHAPPMGHWSRAGENKLEGLQEVGAIAFVPREVLAGRLVAPRFGYGEERAVAEGPMAALDDRPRPGREPTITLEAKAWLVSLACRKTKDLGYPHKLWTTRLLARHAREHGPAQGHACLANLAQGTVRSQSWPG